MTLGAPSCRATPSSRPASSPHPLPSTSQRTPARSKLIHAPPPLQDALRLAQEEAAASATSAAEAQARCEAVTQRLAAGAERRASHSHASTRVSEAASPSLLERQRGRPASAQHSPTDAAAFVAADRDAPDSDTDDAVQVCSLRQAFAAHLHRLLCRPSYAPGHETAALTLTATGLVHQGPLAARRTGVASRSAAGAAVHAPACLCM
jgi:hypothetical protein